MLSKFFSRKWLLILTAVALLVAACAAANPTGTPISVTPFMTPTVTPVIPSPPPHITLVPTPMPAKYLFGTLYVLDSTNTDTLEMSYTDPGWPSYVGLRQNTLFYAYRCSGGELLFDFFDSRIVRKKVTQDVFTITSIACTGKLELMVVRPMYMEYDLQWREGEIIEATQSEAVPYNIWSIESYVFVTAGSTLELLYRFK